MHAGRKVFQETVAHDVYRNTNMHISWKELIHQRIITTEIIIDAVTFQGILI